MKIKKNSREAISLVNYLEKNLQYTRALKDRQLCYLKEKKNSREAISLVKNLEKKLQYTRALKYTGCLSLAVRL